MEKQKDLVFWKWGLLIGLLTSALTDSAWAREDLIPGSRYLSGRAAGLGGAHLPLGDDGASALFENPAALGKIRTAHLEPFNFQLQANTKYATSPGIDFGFTKIHSLKSYASVLKEDYPGERHGAGFTLLPNFYARGFAFGILYKRRVSARHDGDSITYRSTYQIIPAIAGGLRLAHGVVRLGYSLQWVNQASGELTVPTDEDPLGYSEKLAEGSAISHNVGVAVTLPVTYLPSFNLVARNVFGAKFRTPSFFSLAENSSGAPPTEPMTVDASFSIHPRLLRTMHANLILALKDVTNRSDIPLYGRVASGIELSFRDRFYIRGGWGNTWPSAGLGYRTSKGEYSLSWYSEELGTSMRSERDIRFALHWQMKAF